MQKIKTFLRSVWLSCTSPKYYAEILRTKFSFSLKYLLAFQVIITVVIALFVLIPVSQLNVLGMLNGVKNIYPQDLEITVQDGRLSINKPLPYKIALPVMMHDEMRPTRISGDEGEVKNLVVFDTDKNIQGAQDVFDQQSFMVITETTMYTREGARDGLKVYPIPDSDSFQVNQNMVDQAFGKITGSKFVQQKLYVPLLALFFVIIVLPVMFVAALVMVAVYGFFVWLMGRILSNWMLAGQMLSYSKAVQVSIHSLTLINVLQWIFRFSGHGDFLQGTGYLVAFLVWTAFVLFQSFHMKGSARMAMTSSAPRKAAPAKSRRPAKAAKAPAKKARR